MQTREMSTKNKRNRKNTNNSNNNYNDKIRLKTSRKDSSITSETSSTTSEEEKSKIVNEIQTKSENKMNVKDEDKLNKEEQEIVKEKGKRPEDQEIPLSFASFYYSLKVTKGKGTAHIPSPPHFTLSN
jgi:hypothetical protein